MTLVEIMVVVAVIGLLVVLAIPSMRNARVGSITRSCRENQRVIYNAVIMYEQDTATTLESIKLGGGFIRNTLLGAGYVKNMSTFQCPGVALKGYGCYTLLYTSNGSFSNTWCWDFGWFHYVY